MRSAAMRTQLGNNVDGVTEAAHAPTNQPTNQPTNRPTDHSIPSAANRTRSLPGLPPHWKQCCLALQCRQQTCGK
ncbi:hypothetical protein EYF80_007071 [Liparis tanakae]|uniref:Uncharacterized protein n=1 Tax=Liparis tanakae TaxID=230148 RepID=A0A4Z2IZD0_9TELE|nr:hypothetical protein EYF80_007071 [Liparis tanakae]